LLQQHFLHFRLAIDFNYRFPFLKKLIFVTWPDQTSDLSVKKLKQNQVTLLQKFMIFLFHLFEWFWKS